MVAVAVNAITLTVSGNMLGISPRCKNSILNFSPLIIKQSVNINKLWLLLSHYHFLIQWASSTMKPTRLSLYTFDDNVFFHSIDINRDSGFVKTIWNSPFFILFLTVEDADSLSDMTAAERPVSVLIKPDPSSVQSMETQLLQLIYSLLPSQNKKFEVKVYITVACWQWHKNIISTYKFL